VGGSTGELLGDGGKVDAIGFLEGGLADPVLLGMMEAA